MIIGCISVLPVWRDQYSDVKFVAIESEKRGIILPGGKWHPGESFHETATRELYEETDIAAAKQRFLFGGASAIQDSPYGKDAYTYSFLTTPKGISPRCNEVLQQKLERIKQGKYKYESKEGKVVLARWEDLFESVYGPYYLILREVFERYSKLEDLGVV